MPYLAPKVEPNACAFGIRRIALSAALILTPTFVVGMSSLVCASVPSLTVNGSAASVMQAERNDRVFVPAKSVFSQLGETVATDSQHLIVRSKSGTELARMTLGSREATMKGTAQTLAATPFTAHGALMVPLRFVSEAAGATVLYSASPRAIDIRKAGAVVAAAPVVAQAASSSVQATDAATAAPAAAAVATPDAGIPWWVWLIAALVLLGLVFAFLRRKKEPIIATSGTGRGGDPKITTRH